MKKTYETPKLEEFGTLAELTQSGLAYTGEVNIVFAPSAP